ncbi:glucokinase [Desulfonatronum thiosulfatophilum]|uniref:Glucokinase n=1 Tax=Desulfonatronum thiosulfatophilum TaxID=617002 RepID=A0A1G6BZ48_9BACT|nr:glucokinase [Desulfonatronum thiosulfatophilum]SDB25874.1 glucokinase [Desulfonatronum thiosulfatophilum]
MTLNPHSLPRHSPQYFLAADIGGTNSRFALFRHHNHTLEKSDVIRIPTRQAGSFAELLSLLKQSRLGPFINDCRAAALAVPGAVQHGIYANPPNIPWDIDIPGTDLQGLPKTTIILNDFAAQAYACKTGAVDQAVPINEGRPDNQGVVGVIGAGTGLGHGMLVPLTEERYLALPSEAGHAAFAFTNHEERSYERFVMQRLGLDYVYADVIVSGQGLALLHHFHFGKKVLPHQAAAAMNDESPVLQWFTRFYGRVCRHFALNVLATGGMYIAGGVAAKNPILVQHPEFLREFHNNPNYGELLRDIPIFLNTNEDSGLWGAALAAQLAADVPQPAKLVQIDGKSS